VGDTQYALCDGLSIAYQVAGDGPIDVVVAGSFVSHVELIWTLPEAKAFFDRMTAFCRVLIFDKAGVGLSDPVPTVRSVDDRVRELEAVMDAAGFERPVVFGISEGGPAAILFAATHPERTRALVLTGTYAWSGYLSWEDIDADPAILQERARAEMGDKYVPQAPQILRMQALGRAARSSWGTGEALRQLLPSIKSLRQLGMLERMSASPGMARATLEAVFRLDVRPALPAISAPTLVIHATDDAVPVQGGRYLADNIAGAVFLEVAGNDHAPWFSEPDRITDAIEQFLTGTHGAGTGSHRVLRTVLFSDMVSSTERAAAMGDDRWRALLQRFGEVMADLVARFGGIVVKSTGDGHLATFDGPTQAIRCAEALRSQAESLGVEVRAGVHTGECELMGDDIGGIGVHIAARIVDQASAGEILVSSAVRDLVVGSGMGFSERGAHVLKGVPGEWHLLAVDPGGARPGSAEAELVAVPTPAPGDTMRRSDRAVAAIARRTPWLIRGMARLTPATGRR
jgi:pimeloyl-ACP methyl ester carboxylesterase/class 3 adenylate cyclase